MDIPSVPRARFGEEVSMKILDVIVAILVVLGGLNWGMVGLFNYDVVAALFGEMSVLARTSYIIVGLAALYEVAMIPMARRRWGLTWGEEGHPSKA
jgi:uncharacterized membrane protein YuzA (DUF378 family)